MPSPPPSAELHATQPAAPQPTAPLRATPPHATPPHATPLHATPLHATLLAHPWIVGSIALLWINDHVLKVHWPSALTGKLSDAAGLVFFPVVLLALLSLAARAARRPPAAIGFRSLLLCALVTGAVFAWVKLDPAGTAWYRHALGALQWPLRAALRLGHGQGLPALRRVVAVTDPTDVWTLPFVMIAPWLARRAR
ncbi:hypothetical protein [Pendulispora albinea]|uniref:Uncharacterized protein n=1 Tax=Pendulispora albinea TaxID=2741071 RepID=A0ABZ2M539_9BACT